jgi:DNA-binding transcriptional regulator YiaG
MSIDISASDDARTLEADPTTLADILAELKRIRHALGLAQALAVGEKDLARLLGISPATLARWKASGRLVPGIRQGGRILYVMDGPRGVRAWLSAGMPDAKTWKAVQGA